MDVDPTKKHCSFCAEQGQAGEPLFGGHGAFVCGDCVDYYAGVLAEYRLNGVAGPPPWPEMSDADVLGRLPQIAQTGAQVDRFLVEWVDLARSRKLSWTEIGRALGVSRQAAWERFSGRDSDRPTQDRTG